MEQSRYSTVEMGMGGERYRYEKARERIREDLRKTKRCLLW